MEPVAPRLHTRALPRKIVDALLKNYAFWLAVLALGCIVAERIAPWRKDQGLARPQLLQDLFWLLFNGIAAGVLFKSLLGFLQSSLSDGFRLLTTVDPETLHLLAGKRIVIQFGIALVVADFIEYLVHNALHRWNPLWKIHRVHHSITTLDWIGNFRFHWGEIIVYNVAKHLPMAMLGADGNALLAAAVVATLIGLLNHANLNISWGALRYVFNSPRMHVWHHDRHPSRQAGFNFGVVFSLWDWIFGTAYMPADGSQPKALGFQRMEEVPASLAMRFFLPGVNRQS